MVTNTVLFRLVDRAIGGNLDEQLATWARAGMSRRVAARLLSEQLDGIEISHATLGRWLAEAAR